MIAHRRRAASVALKKATAVPKISTAAVKTSTVAVKTWRDKLRAATAGILVISLEIPHLRRSEYFSYTAHGLTAAATK
jgi:hypothetical protein